MTEPSSNTSPTALAFYDPDSSCWRMSQGCLLSEAPELLQRLPAWGTTVDGVLYEHQTPARLIDVRDGSALLGTPTTATSGRSAEFRRGAAPNPQELAALLPPPRGMPTPRAADSYERRNRKTMIRSRDEGGDMTLTTWAKVVVPELLPTPTAWLGRRPSQAIGDPERWHDPERSNELSDQMAALLPTPTARDWKDTGNLKETVPDDDSLLPRAIAHHVTGACSPQPSPDGKES